MEELETNQVKEKKVGVFFAMHPDYLSKLTPLLITEGSRLWNGAIKRRVGNPMYYIFYGPETYIKLWKDSKDNLLYYVGSYDGFFFSYNEPEIITVRLNEVQYDESTVTCKTKNIKLVFGVPFINILRKIHEFIGAPVATLLCEKIYG